MPHPEEFLVAEYEASWAIVRDIDDRRFRITRLFLALNASLVVAVGVLISSGFDLAPADWVWILLLGTLVIWVTAGILWRVLMSERVANVRLRQKINLIRTLLTNPYRGNPDMDKYFTSGNPEIVFDSHVPDPLGSTLRRLRPLFLLVPGAWLVAFLVALGLLVTQ